MLLSILLPGHVQMDKAASASATGIAIAFIVAASFVVFAVWALDVAVAVAVVSCLPLFNFVAYQTMLISWLGIFFCRFESSACCCCFCFFAFGRWHWRLFAGFFTLLLCASAYVYMCVCFFLLLWLWLWLFFFCFVALFDNFTHKYHVDGRINLAINVVTHVHPELNVINVWYVYVYVCVRFGWMVISELYVVVIVAAFPTKNKAYFKALSLNYLYLFLSILVCLVTQN